MTEKVNVKFPIVRDIVEGGQHFQKSLNKDDIVKCLFCGYPFKLNYRTTHLAEDSMEIVDCPECGRHVSVLYYFDKVENRKRDPVRVAYHRGQRSKQGGL